MKSPDGLLGAGATHDAGTEFAMPSNVDDTLLLFALRGERVENQPGRPRDLALSLYMRGLQIVYDE